MGDRGAGKTWLSLYLTQVFSGDEYCNLKAKIQTIPSQNPTVDSPKSFDWDEFEHRQLKNIRIFTICLHPPTEAGESPDNSFFWEESEEPDECVRTLLIKLGHWIGVDFPEHTGLFELATRFDRELSGKEQEQNRWILILDSIFEIKKEIRDTLEENLLSQINQFSHVAFVFTGRGKIPLWKTPELRIDEKDVIRLDNFDPQDIQRQIETLNQQEDSDSTSKTRNSLKNKVSKLSGGFPYNTYFLNAALSQPRSHSQTEEAQLIAALDALIHELLQGHTRERKFLEPLSIFQFYQGWEIQSLIVAYFEAIYPREVDSYKENRRAILDIRLRLPETNLVEWNEGKRAFVMNESVRFVLEKHLELSQKGLWEQLHKIASHLYDEAANQAKNEDSKQRAQALSKYHLSRAN